MSRDDLNTFDAELMAHSEDAILVEIDSEEVWLPKSVVGDFDDAEVGDFITLDVPEWLAEDRGLI